MRFLLFFLLAGYSLIAQDNHPTVDGFEISYHEKDFFNLDTIKMVRMNSVVNLNADTVITAIHLKIMDKLGNSVIYEVDYPVDSSTITDSEGMILFKREDDKCYINSSSEIPLNRYLYRITTENANGALSAVYEVLQ